MKIIVDIERVLMRIYQRTYYSRRLGRESDERPLPGKEQEELLRAEIETAVHDLALRLPGAIGGVDVDTRYITIEWRDGGLTDDLGLLMSLERELENYLALSVLEELETDFELCVGLNELRRRAFRQIESVVDNGSEVSVQRCRV